MPISYTVKQGDTLNGIASSYGYKDYKEAGVGSVKSGNFDLITPGETINLGNANKSLVEPGVYKVGNVYQDASGKSINYTPAMQTTTSLDRQDKNTATEDSTASKNIIITAQNSVSDSNFAATLRNVVIKKIS